MRDDRVYLQHIADNIAVIEEYLRTETGTPDEQLFRSDGRTQDAVLRRLETLTEATGHLSDGFKERYPDAPWGQIYGFRNRLAHGYLELDLNVVWRVVSEYLPALKEVVRAEIGDVY